MNVYLREMRKGLRSVLLWSLGIVFFLAASSTKYAAMADTPSAMDILFQLPLGLQAFFGVGQLDFTTAIGFYGMLYPYMLLLVAIHASMLGAVIVAKEERDKTSEFLYVKPATRGGILTAKLLAALTQVLALTALNWAGALTVMAAFGESAGIAIRTLMIAMLLIQLLFLALGIAAAAVWQRPKAATGIATGVMLGTYLISIAIDVNQNIGWLRGFTPFSYFDYRGVISSGAGLSVPYTLLALGLTAGLMAAAYIRFAKRDVTV